MAAEKGNDRILYIDGFRGIAALGVAWFHIYTSMSEPAANPCLAKAHTGTAAVLLNYVAVWGRWGVHLFFIISGFVLAHSLQRKYLITGLPSIGRYLVRRSVRLDPSYWFALALTLLALTFSDDTSFVHLHAWKVHSFSEFLTNAFYLYSFFDHGAILSVSWTLVIEIQLYIFFAFLLYIAYLVMKGFTISKEKAAFAVLMAVAVFSLCWHFVPFFYIPVPFLSGYFFIFVMGVLVYNSFIEKAYLPMLIVYTLVLVVAFFKKHDTSLIAILLFSALICAAHYISFCRNKLEGTILLYFGKLSYCIYLLHIPVGLITASFLIKHVAPLLGFNLAVHFLIAVCSMATTVAASHVVNRFIEQGSIRLSKKIAVM